MPKKFTGENSKAAEARARKDAVRKEETAKKLKEAEDKLWEDNDKHLLRKQQRKQEEEKKHLDKLQKKQETEKLLAEELKTLKSAKPEKTVEKVSKFEIDKMKEREAAEAAAAEAARQAALRNISENHHLDLLVENVNRIEVEGAVARNVDEAISILGDGSEPLPDNHPEKRLRAAYLEFEEENLERLKKENPNMRLSQIRQLLKREWQKSPKNPLNKVFLSS